jgi:soluble cytochrome b562
MKFRTLLLTCCLIASVFSLRADEDTPLEKQMQIMARSMKQLSQQIADSTKQQESITLLETLKKAASDSKGLDPRKTASIPQANREKFLTDYKAQMDKLSEAFNQIEEALKAGKYDQAKAQLATVGSIKKEGHSKFKQD